MLEPAARVSRPRPPTVATSISGGRLRLLGHLLPPRENERCAFRSSARGWVARESSAMDLGYDLGAMAPDVAMCARAYARKHCGPLLGDIVREGGGAGFIWATSSLLRQCLIAGGRAQGRG